MNQVTHQLGKAELRRQLIQERRSLSQEIWREKCDRLCRHLQSSSLFTQADVILAYFSFRQEPDLSPLFTTNHKWGFSRVESKSLTWHSWKPGETISTGVYGISEPHPSYPALQPDQVDLILVPAVACDVRGYRLGYGGGFYDRMLGSPKWASKPTIGIVFDFAYLPQLPVEPWDIRLHRVCTETGLKWVES